jgi:hypothetical protein
LNEVTHLPVARIADGMVPLPAHATVEFPFSARGWRSGHVNMHRRLKDTRLEAVVINARLSVVRVLCNKK